MDAPKKGADAMSFADASALVDRLQIISGVVVILLALVQVMWLKKKARFLRLTALVAFILMLGGLAFGKYYAQTAPKRFEPIEASQPKVAISAYTEAIRLNPTDSELYFRRGRTDLRLGNYAGAVGDFTKAIDLSPNRIDYLEGRAFAFLFLRDIAAAQQDLNKTFSGGYKSSEANAIQGMIYDVQGRYQDAIPQYTAALLGDPLGLNRCVSLVSRGDDYERLEKYEEAIADYTMAYNSCNGYNHVTALVNRGVAHWRMFQNEAAFADWDAALKLDPNEAIVFKDRGGAFLDSGNLERALLDFNRYIELRPNDPYGWTTRSELYIKMTDPIRAASDLQHAQDLYREKRARLYPSQIRTPFGTITLME
jgi:tetratricopeptide (TPR) repeat protein